MWKLRLRQRVPDIAYESGLRAAYRPDVARWSSLRAIRRYSQENHLIFVSPDLPSRECKRINWREMVFIAACRPIELLANKNCISSFISREIYNRYNISHQEKKNASVFRSHTENSAMNNLNAHSLRMIFLFLYRANVLLIDKNWISFVLISRHI